MSSPAVTRQLHISKRHIQGFVFAGAVGGGLDKPTASVFCGVGEAGLVEAIGSVLSDAVEDGSGEGCALMTTFGCRPSIDAISTAADATSCVKVRRMPVSVRDCALVGIIRFDDRKFADDSDLDADDRAPGVGNGGPNFRRITLINRSA